MVTERDIEVLKALALYFVLNRVQIQRLCFPDDGAGRVTRRRIQSLVEAKLINRTHMQVVSVLGTAGPVYYPAKKGCELLAEHYEDDRYLLTPTQTPQTHHLYHWLAVSDVHIAIDQAIRRLADITLDGWLNEWDVANKDETEPQKRYRLYTLIQQKPKLVSAPDAAFMLTMGRHSKVFYLEIDRNTSGVHQVAASKTPGYAAMAEQQLHRRHFPATTLPTFAVIMVAPTEKRREGLRRAIADKPGSPLWRFVVARELEPEAFLHDPIFYPCVGEPGPLVKPKAAEVPS
jgi:hypothetical protein